MKKRVILSILAAGASASALAQGLPQPGNQAQQFQQIQPAQGALVPGQANPSQPAPASVQVVQAAPAPIAPAPISVQQPVTLPPLPAGNGVPTPVDVEKVMADFFGLTAAQIRELRRQATSRQRAANTFPSVPPNPVTGSVLVSLSPGSTPPVIRLFPNFATSVVLTDAGGNPWPIENFSVGNAAKFDVRRLDKGAPDGSALSIVPLGHYDQSNVILYLKGLSTPVALSLVTGQKDVDFRVDVRVAARGPNEQFTSAGLPPAGNPQLLSLLEGVFPDGAKKLKVTGADANEVQAWVTRSNKLFLRSSAPVISPAWLGHIRSSDGTGAYEFMPTPRVLLMRDGKIQSVNIEGW